MANDEGFDSKRTAVAVALRYDHGRSVPHLVAKGRNDVATAIEERALEAGVPIFRDGVMAHSLEQLEIDQAISPELYHAVAQIIGFLMRKSIPGAATTAKPVG